MAIVDFECPECGDYTLLEVQLQKEYWSVARVYKEGWTEQGALLDSIGIGDTEAYTCNECGFQIPAYGPSDLFEWLSERGMLSPDDEEE